MTGDEAVRRVKVALSEMGYGDIDVAVEVSKLDGYPYLTAWTDEVPAAVWWTARSMADWRCPCWSCWVENSADEVVAAACSLGDCANLGPARPPREFLVSA